MADNKRLVSTDAEPNKPYSHLSQEEIVELYESEGITSENYFETIKRLSNLKKEKEDELSLLKDGWADERLVFSIFGKKTQEEVEEFELKSKKIDDLISEVAFLKKKIYAIENENHSFAHTIHASTRRFKTRTTPFPSTELRNKIVCGTLGFAKYMAKYYYYKTDNSVSYDDLVQVASLALMSAAHYYIPSDQATFITYARKCIDSALKKEVYGKKKKKRPYKPEEFFQKEKDNVKYIKMFLEVLSEYESNSGEAIFRIANIFREKVRSHNREMRLRGETNRLYPSYSGKCTVEKFNTIFRRVNTLIKNSKINLFLTDDDIELASLLAEQENIEPKSKETYKLLYYFNSYLSKLQFIEDFLTTEKELTDKNDGITPTDEEILNELNRKIKIDNKDIYIIRKENKGKFRYGPYYTPLLDYYSQYKAKYDVDPFIPEDEYTRGNFISKQKERDEIMEEYDDYYGLSVTDYAKFENINNMISEIQRCGATKIVLIKGDEEDSQKYIDWKVFVDGEHYDNGDIFSDEDAIDTLIKITEEFPRLEEDEYLNMILQQRRDSVNEVLNEHNADIIQYNRKIARLIELGRNYGNYKKYLKSSQLELVKENIEILYGDDSELLVLMSNSRNKKSPNASLSLEEEVINNMFLKDYYDAVSELPKIEEQVLLRYFDEEGIHSIKAKDIGDELGISEGQVYKVKTRALKKLSQNQTLQRYTQE